MDWGFIVKQISKTGILICVVHMKVIWPINLSVVDCWTCLQANAEESAPESNPFMFLKSLLLFEELLLVIILVL